jgi:hypothetical protein
MRLIQHNCYLLLLITLLFACGKDANEATNPGNSGGSAQPGSRSAADCEKAWGDFLGTYKVGTVKAYESTSSTENAGAPAVVTKSAWMETIKEVTAESVTQENVSLPSDPSPGIESASGTSTTTLTKQQFLESCRAPAGGRVPSGAYQAEVLEQRIEEVTVPAGTFRCRYVKTRLSNPADDRDYESLNESWTTDDARSLFVKSKALSTAAISGSNVRTQTETVLTRFTVP